MAKARIGHFVEAQILEALGVDYIDESEVLTPADEEHHINKWKFSVPFVCGCRNLGEALRRINEGAAMMRTKGEAGTGDVVEAVRHARAVNSEIRRVSCMDDDELYTYAKDIRAPYDLVKETAELGRLPVVNFRGRRRGHPGRCRADDAAWAWTAYSSAAAYSKAGSPAKTRQRHREGRDPLHRREDPGRCQPQPGRSHGRHQRDARRGHPGQARLVSASLPNRHLRAWRCHPAHPSDVPNCRPI